PAVGRSDLDRILEALATQVAPHGHFYVYGEPQRLARVVAAIAGRGLLSSADWTAWLSPITDPAPFADWREAYSTQVGLARVHDVTAFVERIYIEARLDKGSTALLPAAEKALSLLP